MGESNNSGRAAHQAGPGRAHHLDSSCILTAANPIQRQGTLCSAADTLFCSPTPFCSRWGWGPVAALRHFVRLPPCRRPPSRRAPWAASASHLQGICIPCASLLFAFAAPFPAPGRASSQTCIPGARVKHSGACAPIPCTHCQRQSCRGELQQRDMPYHGSCHGLTRHHAIAAPDPLRSAPLLLLGSLPSVQAPPCVMARTITRSCNPARRVHPAQQHASVCDVLDHVSKSAYVVVVSTLVNLQGKSTGKSRLSRGKLHLRGPAGRPPPSLLRPRPYSQPLQTAILVAKRSSTVRAAAVVESTSQVCYRTLPW